MKIILLISTGENMACDVSPLIILKLFGISPNYRYVILLSYMALITERNLLIRTNSFRIAAR